MNLIPDLRNNHEVTLEHCSVLLEKLATTLQQIEGKQTWFDVTKEIDPSYLQDHYEEFFEGEEFGRLFQTELGKGVLVGTFFQRLLERKLLGEET
jgi:hypothetical protein